MDVGGWESLAMVSAAGWIFLTAGRRERRIADLRLPDCGRCKRRSVVAADYYELFAMAAAVALSSARVRCALVGALSKGSARVLKSSVDDVEKEAGSKC